MRRLKLLLFMLVFPLGAQSEDSLVFTSDEALVSRQGTESIVTLTGNVQIESGDYLVQAHSLTFFSKDNNQITGSGGVSLVNQKQTTTLEGQSLVYDRSRDSVQLRGSAQLVNVREGLTLSAIQITLRQEGKQVLAEGTVRFTTEDTYAEAEVLRYDKDQNTLDLVGSAQLHRRGEQLAARRIWINLNNDQILMEDQVSGRVLLDRGEKATREGVP